MLAIGRWLGRDEYSYFTVLTSLKAANLFFAEAVPNFTAAAAAA